MALLAPIAIAWSSPEKVGCRWAAQFWATRRRASCTKSTYRNVRVGSQADMVLRRGRRLLCLRNRTLPKCAALVRFVPTPDAGRMAEGFVEEAGPPRE